MSKFTPRYTGGPTVRSNNTDSHFLRTDRGIHPDSDDYEETLRGTSHRTGNASLHTSRKDVQGLSFWRGEEYEEEEPREEEEWEERQSPLTFVLVAVIFIVLSAIGWFVFRWASTSSPSTPPLLQANPDPYKIRPENPGGMMIPHQDKLVYGRLSPDGQQPVERLLPPPEQPMGLQQAPQQPSQQAPAYGQQQPYPPQQMTGQNTGYPQAQPGMPQQQEMPAGSQGLYPGEQQTGYPPQQMPPHQGQQPMGAQLPPQQAHPHYPQQMPNAGQQQPGMYPPPNDIASPPAAGAQQQPHGQQNTTQNFIPKMAPPSQRAENDSPPENLDQLIAQEVQRDQLAAMGEGNLSVDQHGVQQRNSEQPFTQPHYAAPSPKKAGKLRASQAGFENDDRPLVATHGKDIASSHKYRVQVSSVPTQESAERELKRFKSGSLSPNFSGKKISIQKLDVAGKGPRYRLLAGSFPNRESASQFCRKLKGQGIDCLIVNPTPE